jgi:hypothetical protein
MVKHGVFATFRADPLFAPRFRPSPPGVRAAVVPLPCRSRWYQGVPYPGGGETRKRGTTSAEVGVPELGAPTSATPGQVFPDRFGPGGGLTGQSEEQA